VAPYNHEDLTHYVAGGYDFVNNDNDPWDDHGHGTPVKYPARYDTVICVGSIGKTDIFSGFSQYGAEMELVTPGESILSTTPGDSYASWSGTSMATPPVAGVAALVISRFPSWTNSDVRMVLQDTAKDLGPTGWDEHYGFDKVDAREDANHVGW